MKINIKIALFIEIGEISQKKKPEDRLNCYGFKSALW